MHGHVCWIPFASSCEPVTTALGRKKAYVGWIPLHSLSRETAPEHDGRAGDRRVSLTPGDEREGERVHAEPGAGGSAVPVRASPGSAPCLAGRFCPREKACAGTCRPDPRRGTRRAGAPERSRALGLGAAVRRWLVVARGASATREGRRPRPPRTDRASWQRPEGPPHCPTGPARRTAKTPPGTSTTSA